MLCPQKFKRFLIGRGPSTVSLHSFEGLNRQREASRGLTMFAVDARHLVRELARTEWLFFGCVSFEPRWQGFADLARLAGARPTRAAVLYPRDVASRWQVECETKQAANWEASFVRTDWAAETADVSLPGPTPWTSSRDAIARLLRGGPKGAVIVDITTMPRTCFFPI